MLDTDLRIIKETKDFLFIDKPSGINSVALSHGGRSIADLLLLRDSGSATYSEKPEDAGLLQRLDFETSGVIVAAKSPDSWKLGRELLGRPDVVKSYLVLVEGDLGKEQIVLDNFIGTPNRNAKKVKVYTAKPAKRCRALPARSIIRQVVYSPTLNVSLVRVVVNSARRHQVRAHLGFLKHPLIGDELYGSERTLSDITDSESPKFFLHAEKITLPVTELQRLEVESKIPASMKVILASIFPTTEN